MEKRTEHLYSIDLPIDQALIIRDEIQDTVWSIAKQKGVEGILRDAEFHLTASQPSITTTTVITVVITYLGTKILDKVVDKTLEEIWDMILRELRKKYGEKALVEQEKNYE